jgi:pSer/pThr/pTyr-binding forkhead associated (FHA) protein
MYRFLVLERNAQSREIPAAGREVWIGRSRDFPVALRDRWVSRRHAVVRVREDGLYLEDQHSRTGTFVNGRRLRPGTAVRLKEGDVIVCGVSSLVLRVDGAVAGGGGAVGSNQERGSRSAAQANARLLVLAEGRVRVWPLASTSIVLGKGGASDIQVNEQGVSPEHVRIIFTDGAFYVENWSTTSGLLVNGAHTQTARLITNAAIVMGLAQILFVYDTEPDGSPALAPIEAIPRRRFRRYVARKVNLSRGQLRRIARERPRLNVNFGEAAVRLGFMSPVLWRSVCDAAVADCRAGTGIVSWLRLLLRGK